MLSSDTTIQFPVSGSTVPPRIYNRVIMQTNSASLAVVAAVTSSLLILSGNANRTGCSFVNDSPGNFYLAFGSPVTTNAYSMMAPPVNRALDNNKNLQTPVYTGPLYGMWDVESGSLKITEFTA